MFFSLDDFIFVGIFPALILFYCNSGINIIKYHQKLEENNTEIIKEKLDYTEQMAKFDSDYQKKTSNTQKNALIMVFVFLLLCLGIRYVQTSDILTKLDSPSDLNNKSDTMFLSSDNRYTTTDGRLSFEIPVGFEVHPEFESIFFNETISLGIDSYNQLNNMRSCYEDIATNLALNFGLSSWTDYEEMKSIRLGGATGSYADFLFFDGRYEWIIRAIFLPSADIFIQLVTFSENGDVIQDMMNHLTNSLTFQIETHLTVEDRVSGNSFQSSNDGSLMVLETDGTYRYYQSSEDLTDNYYQGTYEVFYGDEAMAEMSNLTQYGLDIFELLAYVEQQEEHGYVVGLSMDNSHLAFSFDDDGNIIGINPDLPRETVKRTDFCTLITYPEIIVTGGQTIEANSKLNPYIGYYLESKNGMELTNCNNLSVALWVKQENTED